MSDPITRLNAALEGRYRIESELGEGGVGGTTLIRSTNAAEMTDLPVLATASIGALTGAVR